MTAEQRENFRLASGALQLLIDELLPQIIRFVEEGRWAEADELLREFGALHDSPLPGHIFAAGDGPEAVSNKEYVFNPEGDSPPKRFNSAHRASVWLCEFANRLCADDSEGPTAAALMETLGLTRDNCARLAAGIHKERADLLHEAPAPVVVTVAPTLAPKGKRKGRKKNDEHSDDERIARAYVVHHKYKDGEVGNWEPASIPTILELAFGEGHDKNKMLVTRFLKAHFGEKDAYRKYRGACNGERIQKQLLIWSGEVKSFARPREEDAPDGDGGKHRRGNAPGTKPQDRA